METVIFVSLRILTIRKNCNNPRLKPGRVTITMQESIKLAMGSLVFLVVSGAWGK
jgi:hypothetical protein